MFVSLCQVCDFRVDCPQGDDEASCGATDFEDGLDGWFDAGYEDTNYKFSWVRAGDAPYPSGTATDHDHTLANASGHYMWAPGVSVGRWIKSPSLVLAR